MEFMRRWYVECQSLVSVFISNCDRIKQHNSIRNILPFGYGCLVGCRGAVEKAEKGRASGIRPWI
jgi:hypothetical protein